VHVVPTSADLWSGLLRSSCRHQAGARPDR